MKNQQDQAKGVVYTTIPDLKPLVLVVAMVLGLIGVLVYLAMQGEAVAIVILTVCGTLALVVAGSRLSNAARRSEVESRSAQSDEEQTRWRNNVIENMALLDQQAKVQSNLSLSQNRLAHRRANDPLTIETESTEDAPSIVLGSDVYGEL